MNNKIRLMHVVECAGGVDRYLRMLTSRMDRERFEQILVCSDDFRREEYEDFVDEFVQVHEMQNALSPSKDGAAVKRVRKLIRQWKPDVVYCHSSKGGGIGRLAALGLGVKVMYNPHGWAFLMKGSKVKSWIYLMIERTLAHATDQFVMISNFEKMLAVQRHVGNVDRMKVIFNGVVTEDIRKFAASSMISRRDVGIPEDAYVIGMVGRISPQKAPDVFVRMAVEVVKKIPKAWFVIVGDGEQKGNILALAEQLGVVGRLTITGWTENPIDYMKLFDQAVLLSRWEGFGLVLAEYMTLEKPIVATAVDAIPDLITDYENGLLVEPDSQEKVAAAICEIYENKELKYKLINNGKMRVNAFFDISRVANEHERLIVKISGRGGIGDDRLLINDYFRLKDYKIIAAIGDERRMVA